MPRKKQDETPDTSSVSVPQLNSRAEGIRIAKEAAAARGFRLFTLKELHAMREDYIFESPGLMRIFRGPINAGARIGIGGGTGVGKSSLAKRIASDWRRAFPDRIVLIADFEQAEEGSPHRAAANHWNMEDDGIQILPWSGTGEGFYDYMIDLIKLGVPISGVIFDSLHSMTPRQQMTTDLDADHKQYAQMASMMSNVLRKSTGVLGACNITQIWILQQRTNPAAGGATSNKMGKAVEHYADVLINLTGGINSKDARLIDGETKQVFGAVSHSTAAKKRKGAEDFKPLSEVDLYISFDGGVDDYMNLAAAIEEMFAVEGKQILTVPLPRERADEEGPHVASEVCQDLIDNDYGPDVEGVDYTVKRTLVKVTEEVEVEGETVEQVTEFFDTSLIIKGPGKQSSALGRNVLMANMMEASPKFNQYCYRTFMSQFEAPRRPMYLGGFSYPSGEQLEALLTELDAGAEPVLPD